MKIERIEIPGLAQFSYVVSSQGKAVVIDPIRDTDCYIRYLTQQNLTLTHVLETHIHADFAAGSKALAEETGAELALSAYDKGEHYQYAMPHSSLGNGDSIMLGTLRLEALYTPGHTPEHLSFVLFDAERSAIEPMALFTGDFLFVGALGRPDLLGEEAKLGLAHELFRSLHHRLESFPDSVQVYPGHGAGSLCGSGMSERVESTLGFERRTNPLFQMDEETFVKEILGSVPPMPAYYPRMKDLNATGARAVTALSEPRPLSPAELQALLKQEEIVVIDLRRPEAFGGAHIIGSINIGAGQNLSLWAGWLLAPESRIVFVNDKGDDEESRRALLHVGLDRLVGFLAGGMPAWIDAGFDFDRTPQFSTDQVKRHDEHIEILDVRSDKEWQSGVIKGARHLMLGDLPERFSELSKERQYIVVCGSGYRSSIAASLLVREGFENVGSMAGGMGAWNRKDFPVVT